MSVTEKQFWTEGIKEGENREREWFLEVLKDRICFDHLANNVCDHRECYGNLELIEKIEKRQK